MGVDGNGDRSEGEPLATELDPAAETPQGDAADAAAGADTPADGAAPDADAPLETGRLAFDDNVRLPWLEADEDDEEPFEGRNAGQLAALLIMGVLALAVIGGGIWWAVHHRKDAVLVADGSVIAAPKQPYKEQPKDPGGKTFAGTGDTSFAVAKGQTRPVQLDDSAAPKMPTAAPTASTAMLPPGPGPGPSTATGGSGVGVQVAAYSSRASAEAGWTRLSAQNEVLSGLNHRIVEGSADIGTVYRLQVLAADVAGAHALCGKLKAAGLACQVKN